MRRGGDLALDVEHEQAELAAYMGADFRLDRLQHYQQTLADEFADCGEEQGFYRTSRGYLYNLTAFAITGTKLPYLRALTRLVPRGARLLDYGCGIGSDGLMLLEAGYRVEFADFDNPSMQYLRWRLDRRGLSAPVHDLDRGVPSGFDAAYAFDVVEHVEDPFAFLRQMESRAGLVMVNLLEPELEEQEIHHELPIGPILDRAARGTLRFYRIYASRSHLVAYEPSEAGPTRRAGNRARLAVGRLHDRIRFHGARVASRLRSGPGIAC